MAVICFTIPGVPLGKPRMTRSDRWKKRPCVTKFWEWKDNVIKHCGEIPDPESIIQLNWLAYFEPPASWSKRKRAALFGQLHRYKPDRDNIDKAILDSLFKDDSAIASGFLEKRWGSPARIEVTIITLEKQK